jgi:hypothetical protein
MKKSRFETEPWSETNRLPIEMDQFNFIRHLAESNPTQVFTREGMKEAIAKEFGISAEVSEAVGPGSDTGVLYTIISFLMSDAVYAKRKTHKPFLKHVGLGEYQHVSGPLPIFEGEDGRVFNKLVKEAMVSVKILQGMGWEPERMICEIKTWPAEVVEAAIQRA